MCQNSTVKKSNYKVRFRNGVCPTDGNGASRADIKKYDFFFETGQKWVDTTGKMAFVDLSASVTEELELESASEESTELVNKTLGTTRNSSRNVVSRELNPPYTKDRPNFNSARSGKRASVEFPLPPTEDQNLPQCLIDDARTQSSLSSGSLSPNEAALIPSFGPAFPGFKVSWPLEDPIEARMFRFFVQTIGPAWDVTSSDNVWRDVVPKLALRNPILLNAMFLLSAKFMQALDPAFPAEPFLYHERVLGLLIPYLASQGHVGDDATLAATLLLRGFEDFVAGNEGQSHLSTFDLFMIPYWSPSSRKSGVVEACYFGQVRCEMNSWLLTGQTPRGCYQGFHPDLVSPANDVAWSNRIVWLSVRIAQWATVRQGTREEWEELVALVNEWEVSRPAAFAPFFYQDEDLSQGRYYPEMWFSAATYGDGNIFLHICRLLLAAYDPDLRKLDQETQIMLSQSITVREVKTIVAIARSNSYMLSHRFIASNVVHGFGWRLKDINDQQHMLDFLEAVSKAGWQTETTARWLKSRWGWSN